MTRVERPQPVTAAAVGFEPKTCTEKRVPAVVDIQSPSPRQACLFGALPAFFVDEATCQACDPQYTGTSVDRRALSAPRTVNQDVIVSIYCRHCSSVTVIGSVVTCAIAGVARRTLGSHSTYRPDFDGDEYRSRLTFSPVGDCPEASFISILETVEEHHGGVQPRPSVVRA